MMQMLDAFFTPLLTSLVVLAVAAFLIILLIRLWQAYSIIDEIDRRTKWMSEDLRNLRDDLRNLREEIRVNAVSNTEPKEETTR